MKLSNLGVRFVSNDTDIHAPHPSYPTKLFFNGRPSYLLIPSKWGFILEPEGDMVGYMVGSNLNIAFKRVDLLPIVVDRPDFSGLGAKEKMIAVRDAISARASSENSAFISGAINWWLDQDLERDSHSP